MEQDTRLIDFLISLDEKKLSAGDLNAINEQLKIVFLTIGSETPDNLACMEHIEYGFVETLWGYSFGLKVKGKNLDLINILNRAEDSVIPLEMQEYFHDLTQLEWEACLRMAVIVLISVSYRQGFIKPRDTRLINFLTHLDPEYFTEQGLNAINTQLKEIFLAIGSETEDNLACMEHLEYNLVQYDSGYRYCGLKIKGKNILLSDVLNSSSVLVSVAQEQFPELTEIERDAVVRMIAMILLSFDYWLGEGEEVLELG